MLQKSSTASYLGTESKEQDVPILQLTPKLAILALKTGKNRLPQDFTCQKLKHNNLYTSLVVSLTRKSKLENLTAFLIKVIKLIFVMLNQIVTYEIQK